MLRNPHFFASVAATFLCLGCAQDAPSGAGQRLEISVAPLALTGVTGASYDITVYNSDIDGLGSADTVWSATGVTSGRYGDGQGSVTYIGPCDANTPAGAPNTNTVELVTTGFTSADPADTFQLPCPANRPCRIERSCQSNADVAVVFNLTVMRNARQGFFDVAVNFEDIFCSAKADSCYAANAPLSLLFGNDIVDGPSRDETFVAAIACTGGASIDDSPDPTTLLFTNIEVVCDEETFTFNATGLPGGTNHWATGSHGTRLNFGLFMGSEGLRCDGAPCNKVYYNLALNLENLGQNILANCAMTFQATAHNAESAGTFVNGLIMEDGTSYPAIMFDEVPLTNSAGMAVCDSNPLDGTTLTGNASAVQTGYIGTFGPPMNNPQFCFRSVDGGVMGPIPGTGTQCRSALWSWGSNISGQLGDGTTTRKTVAAQVGTDADWVSVHAGYSYHAVGVKNDGSVWAWGRNFYGQLGQGTVTDSSVPLRVQGPGGVGFLNDVIAGAVGGGSHSLFLKSDGTVWSVGYNGQGQLGDGFLVTRSYPMQVIGLSDVIAIEAGASHSMALKSDGTVWVWGHNLYGQAGQADNLNNNPSVYSAPVQVSGLSGVVAIAAGDRHGLALKNDGTVWTWGRNIRGQLGNGTTDNTHIAAPVNGVANAVAISGGNEASLVLRADGTLLAWGQNATGQLGDGTFINSSVPVVVSAIPGVLAIAGGGGNHFVALKDDGTLWAWGENSEGQLGDGTLTNSNLPIQVLGLSGVYSVSVGFRHTFALAR